MYWDTTADLSRACIPASYLVTVGTREKALIIKKEQSQGQNPVACDRSQSLEKERQRQGHCDRVRTRGAVTDLGWYFIFICDIRPRP